MAEHENYPGWSPKSLSLGATGDENQFNDYACRRFAPSAFGRGFDSPQLHH